MLNILPADPFDITVTNIDFVVLRHHKQEWCTSHDTLNHYILAIALDGDAVYEISGNKKYVKKGDLLFLPKGTERYAKSLTTNLWSYYSVAFDLLFLSEAAKKSIHQIPILITSQIYSIYLNLFNQLSVTWDKRDDGYLIKCRSIISDILYKVISENTSFNMNVPYYWEINNIKNLITENYTKTFTIHELADTINMSPSYFRKKFKEYTGYSVIEYQNTQKIGKACDLLKSRSITISEIAYQLGYDNVYYFSRLFKKKTGLSPTEYKKYY